MILQVLDFANLQSGNYTFSVQSKVNGKESTFKSFQFFIDTPLYKKLWFRISTLTTILLIITLIVYRYITRIRAKNKAKVEKLQLENHLLSLEQKALQLQMNPHFIFNVLNGIKALASSKDNAFELNSTINTFATLLRSVLSNSRKEEISLAQEITTLKSYIELEQQMSSKKFTYNINTHISLDANEVLIPPMLVQPFVENSIKHGIKPIENGVLTINFDEVDNYLHCSIIDNGIGYKQSQKNKEKKSHNSLAVKVTQERIHSLSGNRSFVIEEIKENNNVTGTKVWFKLPLKTDF